MSTWKLLANGVRGVCQNRPTAPRLGICSAIKAAFINARAQLKGSASPRDRKGRGFSNKGVEIYIGHQIPVTFINLCGISLNSP